MKLAPIPLDQRAAPPSTLGAVAPTASAPAAPPRRCPCGRCGSTCTARSISSKPPSSESKKSHNVANRSNGSHQTETSTAAASEPGKAACRRGACDGKSASLIAPDAQGRIAELPPGRSRVRVDASSGREAYSGEGYAVQVASERSAADAEAIFRSLQAKFPNQLGGREPIVRRTDLGPEGIYFRAFIGPFVSKKEASRVCSTLKAAGESCKKRRGGDRPVSGRGTAVAGKPSVNAVAGEMFRNHPADGLF